MLTISQLQFSYPDKQFKLAINSFCAKEGESIAIVGPSGCGKTTLMNAIAGILLPEKGLIRLENTNINQLSDSERRSLRISQIGFIFQDFGLINYLSVLDNILHPYRISPLLKLNNDVKKRAINLAESLGVAKLLSKMPSTLSQGEKQRIAICRALIIDPKLILADEATGNLDPNNKLIIMELLFTAAKENNAALIAVTHDHALLPNFDRVVNINELSRANKHG